MNKTVGKTAYGVAWAVAAPMLLWGWCQQIAFHLAVPHAPLAGVLLLAGGLAIWLAGIFRLKSEGGGLPMNAFPPPRLAIGGAYGLLPHPIYAGFVIAWMGFALWTKSSPALWLGTPLLIAVCLALVWGYERPDLLRRFGPNTSPRPWIGLPALDGDDLSLHQRTGAALAAILPWLLSYGWVKFMGPYPDGIETRMAWEWQIPVIGWTAVIYSSPYLLVPLTFLMQKERMAMRLLMVRTWLCTSVATLIYVCFPLTAAFRPAQPGPLATWIDLEQLAAWPPVAAWPSFHVLWSLLVAQSLAAFLPTWLRYAWVIAVSLTCLTTGMHSVFDLAAAFVVWAVLRHPGQLWRNMLAYSEGMANAWTSWSWGPIRVIRHSVWAGFAAMVGYLVIVSAVGANQTGAVLTVFVCGLVGAGLWAQWVEGSSALSRPFGYYGAVIGGAVGLVGLMLAGRDGTQIAGAFALAAAPMQAIGRLRCLEQGCCHGHHVSWGIKVFNPHSRVICMAHLQGVPLHPTQVYSIMGNVLIGLLLARMWILEIPETSIAGAYLIMAGVLRFIEEAYRGEPQTKTMLGLPLYQWMALASFLAGMLVCLIPSSAAKGFTLPALNHWVWALATGLVCGSAMGIDFPQSTCRFSRLSG